MQNAGLDESQAGIKIARRNINNLRYSDDTTLIAGTKEPLSFLNVEFKVNFFTLLFHFHQEGLQFFFAFWHKGGVICISEVIDISPSNLDSSLCFLQPSVSHDVLFKEQASCNFKAGHHVK